MPSPYKQLVLQHEYMLDCEEPEEVGSGECTLWSYPIALSAQGVMFVPDGVWSTWKPIVAGRAITDSEGSRIEISQNHPLVFPVGMTERDAVVVLTAIFEDMDRGAVYDGDMCYGPIQLGDWLSENLSRSLALSVEAAVLHTVNATNAITLN